MNANQLHKLAAEHLLPFFSGAEIQTQPVKSNSDENCVAFIDPCTIRFKINKSDKYRLEIRRKQKFSKGGEGHVTEYNVVQSFVEGIRDIQAGLKERYKHDLLSTFQRKVVAKAIAPHEAHPVLLDALDQLVKWASRLYEGKPIVSALGFFKKSGGSQSFQNLCQDDFSSVLSNGFDTILEFNFQGKLQSHNCILFNNSPPSFAPYRQGPIAQWTEGGKIALVLNRLGEILVFKNQLLLFARRSGKWHFLTHEPVISQMKQPPSRAIRCAIYESCLDASFSRTGACIGVVKKELQKKWNRIVPQDDEYLHSPKSSKAKAISKIVNHRPFHQLDRRLRQELLSIDGATLMNYKGDILVVGSILKIPGGSTGGGRLAAAKALGEYGLGIKVSQDGGIRGYQNGQDQPIFSVM